MVRTTADGPRARRDGSAIQQQFYAVGATRLTDPCVKVRGLSSKRPGSRVQPS
jgi:hypothetical protein